MATTVTVAIAQAELISLNLHTNNIYKNQVNEVQNRDYRNFIIDTASGFQSKDLPASLEAAWTRSRG